MKEKLNLFFDFITTNLNLILLYGLWVLAVVNDKHDLSVMLLAVIFATEEIKKSMKAL